MILERILSCFSMRENVVWCMALAAVLAACNGKRAASEVDYAADSVFESSFGPSDSFNASSASLDEELPKRADELFDDFILSSPVLKKSGPNVSNFHCFRLCGETRYGSRRNNGSMNRFSWIRIIIPCFITTRNRWIWKSARIWTKWTWNKSIWKNGGSRHAVSNG